MARARYNAVTDRAWPMFKFVARPLSKPWHGKFQPVLAINGSRLVVAAGNYLDVYHFVDSVGLAAPGIRREGSISLQGTHQRKRDITAVTFVEDQGQDRTLYVAYQDGGLDLVILRPPSKARDELGHKSVNSKMITPTEIRTIKAGNNENIVEDDYTGSLSSQNGLVVSLSSNGTSQLVDNQTHATVSCPLELGCRGWTCYASLNSSTPFVAFGTSSRTPLTIYSINNLELSPSPIAILARDTSTLSAPTNSSAVYGICQAPLGAPWGASPQVIASGWFDGQVRVYDMRASHRQSAVRKNASESSSTSTSAPLLPVLSLADPWSYDPIYSVSSGGGSSAYIAAGSARHSVVAFWDVRSPKSTAGWSVHAPGNDPSPVYSVILESSRLFGVTQSRPFVYDFVSVSVVQVRRCG